MAIYGETINQQAPSVTITGATSGSISFDPATVYTTETDELNGSSGNWRRIDKGRVLAYEGDDPRQLPVIEGTATVTITAAAGTRVHYRIGPKNPTSKGIKKDGTVNSDDMVRSQSYIYDGAFTISQARPGNTVTVLRLRAYKSATQEIGGESISGISPTEKSEVVIIKFVHKT